MVPFDAKRWPDRLHGVKLGRHFQKLITEGVGSHETRWCWGLRGGRWEEAVELWREGGRGLWRKGRRLLLPTEVRGGM